MPDNFPLLPEQASTVAPSVDALFWTWVAISAVSALLIGIAIFYFFVRYQRRKTDEIGHQDHGSTALELTWTAIPLVIVLAMFVWGTRVFFDQSRPPANAVEYLATGKQWMWKFQHPSGKREINELHVPIHQPIRLTMISEDVIHSLFVPAFRVKADVLPGRYTTVWFEATKTGEYHIFCAEYCGTEHSLMGGTVYVMEQEDYEAWLAKAPGAVGGQVATGEELFTRFACNTCHFAGPRARGPNLEGAFGTVVKLADGSSVEVDEDYVRESILNPKAKVVSGFEPLMPTFQGQVTEDQLLQLIQYVKSLSGSQTAAAPGDHSGADGSAQTQGAAPASPTTGG